LGGVDVGTGSCGLASFRGVGSLCPDKLVPQ
jgi:hypothetical protein